ncbi:MAG TPA: AAA family ATPase [Clostridia bacterium]|nr:AAA family ATPase [Clostridia bacterium]
MLALPGYIIDEEICKDNGITVYRGRTVQDRAPVIIKAVEEEKADPAGIAKLVYEYEITRNLDIEGIVRPVRLEQAGICFALIMEDPGALFLREYLRSNSIDLTTFFAVAIQVAQTLGQLHQRGIIHRDLRPDNIIIHPDTGTVRITGFGSAVYFSFEGENAPVADAPSGTPEYMAPEQTGRVEQIVDHRSDLYSLGVVLFEMLTGRLPLQAGDPDEWVHAHVAREPESPDKRNPEIPPAVSAIIMKLLSKTPEDRYQSAHGLLWDLEECRRQWSQTGKIGPFRPGQRDVSARLQLPRKLYGRERETEVLRAAFERVCGGEAGVILVSGCAGVGKTMLINEALKPIAEKRGYFVSGKFDQLQQNIPYAPLAYAFGNLIRQIMTESRERLSLWRKKILHAVGRNGAIITKVIPEVEFIIGPQPPVETLQPKEAQNRVLMVFRNFIRVFAGNDHPLVIFLDDLQWADAASLQLIGYLCRTADNRYWLMVGAYRDDEVTKTHPLVITLEELRKEDTPVQHIKLSPLEQSQVMEFIAEALHCHREESDSLAEELYRKSGGNPFFLVQLLRSVYHDRLLRFNIEAGRWEWDMAAIQKLRMADDIVDFILGKLEKLPKETRDVLRLAACLGNTFDLKTLSTVCENPPAEAASCLLPAILAGLVLPAGDAREAQPTSYHGGAADLNEFSHDRVQQAAYSLIPERERRSVHLRIGCLILQNTSQDELDERILSIMDHLNRGLDLVDDPAERLKLAEYNLAAGRKAKASAAYGSALGYLRAGMDLLPDNSWDTCYELSHDLHLERAQCEYMSANTETAESLFDTIIRRTRTELERASVYGLKVILHAGMGDYAGAARIGIDALQRLGVRLPAHPSKLDYVRELLVYKWLMRNRKIEDLIHLPEMEDPVQRKVAELFIRLACVTSFSNPGLYGFVILKAGNHAIKYGNSEMACIGYIGYSIIAGSVLGDYAAGHELAKVSIKLAERYDKNSSKCIVYFTVGAIISHWTQHGKAGLEYLNEAVRCGLEAGDVLTVGYSLGVIFENKYLMGVRLDEIFEEAKKGDSWAKKMKHENLATNAALYQHFVSSLMRQAGESTAPSEDAFEQNRLVQLAAGDRAALATCYFLRMQSYYLRGDYQKALCTAERLQGLADAIMGFLISAEYVFYFSLTITAIYESLPSNDRKRYWKVLKKNQRQMKKWSDSCAANFLHKYLLVAAEMARLCGRGREAISLYEQSIQSAHENGYIQNEAIASELTARYYLATGCNRIAGMYLENAYKGYREWGAGRKAQELKERYPDLLAEIIEAKEDPDLRAMLGDILKATKTSASGTPGEPDVSAIRKAVQTLHNEPDPDRMVEGLLDIAVENAGADKGYLILERDGELFVEAAKEGGKHPATVITPVSLEKSANLSRAMVRYAFRTLEPVVVNDGREAGIFAKDPHIARDPAKSFMCLPVLFSRIFVGVLYLENSLMTGAFTQSRIEVLKFLLSEMVYAKTLKTFLEKGSASTNNGTRPPLVEPLTEREAQVLRLIAAGLSNGEIAESLGMTVNTAKTHVKNIYGKLQANRRVQVIARAKELGIL